MHNSSLHKTRGLQPSRRFVRIYAVMDAASKAVDNAWL